VRHLHLLLALAQDGAEVAIEVVEQAVEGFVLQQAVGLVIAEAEAVQEVFGGEGVGSCVAWAGAA